MFFLLFFSFFFSFLCEYHGSTCICKTQVLRSTDLTLARPPTHSPDSISSSGLCCNELEREGSVDRSFVCPPRPPARAPPARRRRRARPPPRPRRWARVMLALFVAAVGRMCIHLSVAVGRMSCLLPFGRALFAAAVGRMCIHLSLAVGRTTSSPFGGALFVAAVGRMCIHLSPTAVGLNHRSAQG